MKLCKAVNCLLPVQAEADEFCSKCTQEYLKRINQNGSELPKQESMSEKYPNYYKPVGELTEIDVYAVHALFDIQDPSGAIQHASKKLLLSGVRTGNKSITQDVREARDTLTRWLQLNEILP